MRSTIDISIAICTYNGALRLPDVLDALLKQQGTGDVRWEVLVVDNNSTDATAEVVRRYQAAWSDGVPLRYVFEEQQGKAYAVERAVEHARGAWVAFLDDDNVPAPGWIAAAQAFAERHPRAGAFGGQIHGRFEEEPPASFGLIKPLFALNERAEEICYTDNGRVQFGAPGAGLVIRKEAWEEAIPESGLSQKGTTGRRRGQVGEDFETQWYLFQHGWEIWHNPEMHMDHVIPAARFEEEYLREFVRAIASSRHTLRMMRLQSWQRPLAVAGYLLADVWKLVRLAWVYRKTMFDDPFVRARIEMRGHIVMSPFQAGLEYFRRSNGAE